MALRCDSSIRIQWISDGESCLYLNKCLGVSQKLLCAGSGSGIFPKRTIRNIGLNIWNIPSKLVLIFKAPNSYLDPVYLFNASRVIISELRLSFFDWKLHVPPIFCAHSGIISLQIKLEEEINKKYRVVS